MSKFIIALISCVSMGIAGTAQAGWQSECQGIENSAKVSGNCKAIQDQISVFGKFAPPSPFHDLSVSGSNNQYQSGNNASSGGGESTGGTTSGSGSTDAGSTSGSGSSFSDTGTF